MASYRVAEHAGAQQIRSGGIGSRGQRCGAEGRVPAATAPGGDRH